MDGHTCYHCKELTTPGRIAVVLNSLEELKARVPVK